MQTMIWDVLDAHNGIHAMSVRARTAAEAVSVCARMMGWPADRYVAEPAVEQPVFCYTPDDADAVEGLRAEGF